MKRDGVRFAWMVYLLGSSLLVGCGIGEKLPDSYGLHAIDGGKITKLAKGADPLDFGSKVEFILFEKTVQNMGANELRILSIPVVPKRKVVRPEPRTSDEMLNQQQEALEESFKETDAQLSGIPTRAATVETVTKPVKGNPEMIRIAAAGPLKPGLYQLENRIRFFVDRKQLVASLRDGATAALGNADWRTTADFTQALLLTVDATDDAGMEFIAGLPDKLLKAAGDRASKGEYDLAAEGAARARSMAPKNKALAERAAKIILAALFDVRPDHTIVDRKTKLVWWAEVSSPKTWQEATEYVDGLEKGGQTDWRLPAHAELKRLYDRLGLLMDPAKERNSFLGDDREFAPFEWGAEPENIHERACWSALGGSFRFNGGNGDQGNFDLFSRAGKSRVLAVRQDTYPANFALDGAPALWWAAYSGNLDVARKMTESGAQVNGAVKNLTILSAAARCGKPELVELLLEKGAQVDGVTKNNEPALQIAVENNQTACAKVLLAKGATYKIAVGFDGRSNTPLVFVAASKRNIPMVEAFLDAGLPIDTRDGYGNSLLAYATSRGDVEMVQMLIRRGADVNARNPITGRSALQNTDLSPDGRKIREVLESAGGRN